MPDDERWQVVSERLLLDRPPWLRVTEQTLRLPDGSLVHGFLHAESLPFAMALAVRKDGKMVAIEEFQHGPGRVVLHLPAGYLEPGEEPLAAAQQRVAGGDRLRGQRLDLLGRLVRRRRSRHEPGPLLPGPKRSPGRAPAPGDLAGSTRCC